MNCNFCRTPAIYRCSVCGEYLCGEHVRLRTVCPSCTKKNKVQYTIVKVTTDKERDKIREFVKRFWGEEEQLAFDRKFMVAELPSYIAITGNSIAGFVSFEESGNTVIVVALGILPKYQSSGIGSGLIEKVEADAKKMKKGKLLVSTSNDDLPALAFYHSLGFQLFEVKTNVIAEKHGKIVKGIGGLPVRDELRLRKSL